MTHTQTTTQPQTSYSRGNIWATAFIMAVGYLIYNMLPIMMTELAIKNDLHVSHIGLISATYMIGSALASVAAVFWVRRLNWYIVILTSCLLTVPAYLFTSVVTTVPAIAVCFLILGLLNAMVIACAVTLMGDTVDLENSFGLGVGGQVLLAGVVSIILKHYIIPIWNYNGLSIFLSLITLTALFVAIFFFPKEPLKVEKQKIQLPVEKHRHFPGSSRGLLALSTVGLLLFPIGMSSMWPFLELIGIHSGLKPHDSGVIFGTMLSISAVGAFLAARISERFGRILPIMAGSVAILAALLLLHVGVGIIAFSIAMFLFISAWNFILPFQMAIFTLTDSTKRMTPLIPACFLFGACIGNLFATYMVTDVDYRPVYVLAALLSVFSALTFSKVNGYLKANHSVEES